MYRISKQMIRDICDPHIIRRGQVYYDQNRVNIVESEFIDDRYEIRASIRGSRYYVTKVSFNEDGNIQTLGCNCPYFQQYTDPCKHVAALLFAIEGNKIDTFVQKSLTQSQQITSDLIDYFTQSEQVKDRPELKVQFQLTIEAPTFMLRSAKLSLQMKVGVERLYVVKNIKELLNKIENGYSHTFTSKFTLDLTQYKFKDEDYQVILLLQDIAHNEQIQKREFYYPSFSQDRSVTIPPLVNQRFLQLLAQCEDVVLGNEEVSFTIIEDEFPGAFSIVKKGRNYQFGYSLNPNALVPIPQTSYFYWDHRFYHLNNEQSKTLVVIYDMLAQVNGNLILTRSDLEKLSGSVLPILKNYQKLEIDNTITEEFVEHPLDASVYLDIEGDRMLAKLIFAYGEREIIPFSNQVKKEDEKIVVRDMEKETKILTLIEEVPFFFNGSQLFIEGEEAFFSFLYEHLPMLTNYANIFMTTAVKKLFIEVDTAPKINIEYSDANLLEIGFETGDIDKEELNKVFQSLIEKKKYHKMQSGALLSLQSERWREIENLIELNSLKSRDFIDGKVELPAHTAFQIEDLFSSKQEKVKKSKAFKKLIQSISNPEVIDEEVPSSVAAILRDYQERGFYWFATLARYGFGGVLADDMGLGKTLQTITFILSERLKDRKRPPFLVVAPASLIYNWEKEFEKFAPELQVTIIDGPKVEREEKLLQLEKNDVFITSYPLLRRDFQLFEQICFSGLILDEAQAIKNSASLTYKAVKTIKAANKFALSGTPIENKLDELYSLFSVVMPGFFKSQKAFSTLSEELIRKRIMPFILRRKKEEVLKELPEKIETTRHTELTKEQRELYLAYLQRIQQEAMSQLNSEGFDKSRIKILAGLTRLRQLCCHPALFLENYQGESGKLNELLELLDELQQNQRRVLIFSQFTSMLGLIRENLAEKGIVCFYLDGNTPVKERLKMVDEFNEGTETVFLISLKAGGTGLNLTGADTVILFDLWWNPAVEQQAADRAHRIGQKNVVQVVKLVTKGTIEEKIMALQEKKKALFDKVIQSGEGSLSSLTEEDIREILSL